MAVSTYLILPLDVNALSALIGRHRVTGLKKTQDPFISCLQETHFRLKDTYRQSEGMEYIHYADWGAGRATSTR